MIKKPFVDAPSSPFATERIWNIFGREIIRSNIKTFFLNSYTWLYFAKTVPLYLFNNFSILLTLSKLPKAFSMHIVYPLKKNQILWTFRKKSGQKYKWWLTENNSNDQFGKENYAIRYTLNCWFHLISVILLIDFLN